MGEIMAIAIATAGVLGLILTCNIIYRKTLGKAGEEYTARTLRLTDKYKIINNLLLKAGNWTTEIDHVIVSNYGVFVVESKNLAGKIIGTDTDEQWTQILGRNKKNRFYNPLKQNYGHIKAIRNALYDYHNVPLISIVVFSPRAELRVKSKYHVLYTHQLNDTIRSYKMQALTDVQVEQIYKRLKSFNYNGMRNRRLHAKSMKQIALIKKKKQNQYLKD